MEQLQLFINATNVRNTIFGSIPGFVPTFSGGQS